MKLLIVISNLTYGGAERQVVELVNHLESDEFEVHLCILSEHAPLADRLKLPHRLHKIPKRHKFDVSVIYKLWKLIRHLRIDMIHGFLFDAEIASRLAGCFSGVPVVGSERNSSYRYPLLHYWLYRLTNWMTVLCVANSRAGKKQNQVAFGRPDRDYRVIYNGVDVERFRPRDANWDVCGIPQPTARYVLGVVGSFKPQKNHFYLLDIISSLSKQRQDFVVLVAGTKIFEGSDESQGYYEAVTERIMNLGLEDVVQLVGAISNVEYFYPLCDVTLLVSKHEGTPNVALESLACGVPVLATDVADNSYVIPDGEVGYIRQLDQAEEFATAINGVLDDEVTRERMSQGAVAWVEKEFSNEKMVSNFAKTYQLLVEKNSGP